MVKTHCCEDIAVTRRATVATPYHFVESGLPNVYLAGIRYFVCEECGQQTAEIPAVEKLMRAIARTIVETEAQLSGAEIRFLRKRLRKKAVEFAQIVGVTPEQVSRWENGSNPPEKSTDKLIRMYYGSESGDRQLLDKMKGDWLKAISDLNHIEGIHANLSNGHNWKTQAASAGR
jgi:putative zinc finger/helix-turn-helix YgiT family protein